MKKLYSVKWFEVEKRLLEVICDDCLKRIQDNPSYYGFENGYLFNDELNQSTYVCDQCGK